VRLAAIDLVIAAKQPQLLAGLAEDADPMLAVEAAIAMKRDDLAAKALQRALADERWTNRAGAANMAVRALGDREGVVFVKQLLADKEIGVRLAAARVLAHYGERQAALAVFVEALTGDSAITAASDLAFLHDRRGVDALGSAVRDPKRHPDVRARAAAAHRSAQVVTPGLVAALADGNGVVRVEAAAALAMLTR
jgi:HEAT repeat protein